MQKSGDNFIVCIVKGVLGVIIFALIGILAFALVLKLTPLSDGIIKAVMQFIKTTSVFLGCLISVRESKGFIKGLIIGIVFSFIVNLIFKLIGGEGFGKLFTIDMAFCGLIGAICGSLIVNVRKV